MGSQPASRRVALRRTAAVAVVAILAGLGITVTTSQAATANITTLLAALPVITEHTTGYDRDNFNHWIDADTDGCDTREEVLIAESTIAPTTGAGCTVTGSWTSWYDAATWTNTSDIDIDHMVPLEEAWSSGAYNWTHQQRQAFANDLDFGPSLAAVTDNVNQSKGAKDPAEWLPPDTTVHCRYATEWVLVKYRWRLSTDATEANTLSTLLTDCGAETVTVPTRAAVPDATPPAAPFPDVPLTHPFLADITWLANTGITGGYADGTFRPGAVITRQAFAAYLYRYTTGNDSPPPCPYQSFYDVPKNHPFCGHIWWLVSRGIATGYANQTFHPADPVSRQAMAVFLKRYRDSASPTGTACDTGLFTDMPGGTFCQAITWLSTTGITTGYPDGSFKPTAAITRQAMAAFLHRYDLNYGPSAPPVVVTPPQTTTTTAPPTTTTTKPPTTTTTSGIPGNPGDSKNCGDFGTWAQAQGWFNTYFPYYGDVAKLDADGDGIACESLPGAP